jgi:hypothetical protein
VLLPRYLFDLVMEGMLLLLDAVANFSELLSRYTSLTNNKVSLALLIGEDATADAHNLALYLKNKKIGYMIVIEKPVLLS